MNKNTPEKPLSSIEKTERAEALGEAPPFPSAEESDAFPPDDRKRLRKTKIQARDRLPAEEREGLSQRIVERIIASPAFRRAKSVLLYRAVRGEVRLEALEHTPEARGKRFAYPCCVNPAEMAALIPRSPDAWRRGRYGIWEPIGEKSRRIPPEELDFIVCPCTAFDRACNRLGMGGGYYDRYLPLCKHAFIAAAAFEVQKAERLPTDLWDVPMDAVYTEDGAYEKNGARL